MKPVDQASCIMGDQGEGAMKRENKLLTEKCTLLFVESVCLRVVGDEGVRIPVLQRMKQLHLGVLLGLMRETCRGD